MEHNCPICNQLHTVKHSLTVCAKCITLYGTLDKYENPLEFYTIPVTGCYSRCDITPIRGVYLCYHTRQVKRIYPQNDTPPVINSSEEKEFMLKCKHHNDKISNNKECFINDKPCYVMNNNENIYIVLIKTILKKK